MYVAVERRQISEFFQVLFAVENRLIQMRDGPPRGNIVRKKRGQFFRRVLRAIIAPSTKRHEEFVLAVKRHVTVHHGGNADRADPPDHNPVLFFYVRFQLCIAVLQTADDILDRIRPKTVFEAVFPFVTARSDRAVLRIHKHRFDPRRAEFDAERARARLDLLFDSFQCKSPLEAFVVNIISDTKGKFNRILHIRRKNFSEFAFPLRKSPRSPQNKRSRTQILVRERYDRKND